MNNQMEDQDPQKTYLLAGWQRLAVLMKENMSPYLSQVIPKLIIMIKKIISEDDVDIGLGIK